MSSRHDACVNLLLNDLQDEVKVPGVLKTLEAVLEQSGVSSEEVMETLTTDGEIKQSVRVVPTVVR